jgi:RNA recognition motif-containing protein
MERVTSKTLDAFVEFTNFNEAINAVNRFETNRTGGRGGRLGQRHVEVELSSQEALMQELFPKAKNVQWRGARPFIAERDLNDIYNSGFQGFISKEELVMLVKHVDTPQRVSNQVFQIQFLVDIFESGELTLEVSILKGMSTTSI